MWEFQKEGKITFVTVELLTVCIKSVNVAKKLHLANVDSNVVAKKAKMKVLKCVGLSLSSWQSTTVEEEKLKLQCNLVWNTLYIVSYSFKSHKCFNKIK